MRNSLFLRTLLIAPLLLAACSTAEDAAEDMKRAAFEKARKAARAAGGDAIRFRGGDPVQLRITTEGSPIQGAAVAIPGGALPRTVADAMLIIQHAASFAVDLTDGTPIGPVVEAEVRMLEGKWDTGRLALPARVTVPYAEEVSGAAFERVFIGHKDATTGWEDLANLSIDSDTKTLAGNTYSLSPFVALIEPLPSLEPTPDTMILEVLDDDRVVCYHRVPMLDPGIDILMTYGANNPNDLNISITGERGSYLGFNGTTTDPVAPGVGTDLGLLFNLVNFELICEKRYRVARLGAETAQVSISVDEWTEATCNGSTCYGAATLTVQIKVADAKNPKLKGIASMVVTIPAVSWRVP